MFRGTKSKKMSFFFFLKKWFKQVNLVASNSHDFGGHALKHGAILYNEAEVFSLSITNPNGRPILPFDWLIQASLILGHCHKMFSCFLRLRNN